MAFTKEQRLLVLMAIACMGLAVVSAGCVDTAEAAEASRDILKNKTVGFVNSWCFCANLSRDDGESDVATTVNNCFTSINFYKRSKDFVNCANEKEFKTLINPEKLCEGFKKNDPPAPDTATATSTTTNNLQPAPSATSKNGTTKSDDSNSSPTLPDATNLNNTSPETPNNTLPDATKSNTTLPVATKSNTTLPVATNPNTTLPVAPKPNSTSPETGPTIPPPPVEDLTYLAWLIPLILLLVAAMLGLGCYLHRRTKGARGFHHSTKTNGSTKATNGEA